MSLRGIENVKIEQRIANVEVKVAEKQTEIIIKSGEFNPNAGLEVESTTGNTEGETSTVTGRGDSSNLNTDRKKLEKLYQEYQKLGSELADLQNQKNEQERASREAQRNAANSAPQTGKAPTYKDEKKYIVIDDDGNAVAKTEDEIGENKSGAVEVSIITDIEDAEGEIGKAALRSKIAELKNEYETLNNKLTELSTKIETTNETGDALDAMVNEYNCWNKRLELVKSNKEKVEAKLTSLTAAPADEAEAEDAANPLDSQITAKENEIKNKQKDIEDARDAVVKSAAEAKRAARQERKEMIADSKGAYETAIRKADAKRASNESALNNGQYSSDVYFDKNVDDAAKLHKPYIDAKRNKEIADNALKEQYPELNVNGKAPLEVAGEILETHKKTVTEKKNAFIKAQRELDNDNHNISKQEAQKNAKQDWENAALALKGAQGKYDEIMKFAQENRAVQVYDGDRQVSKETNYYTLATADVKAMENAWHAARDKGLATLDETKEKEYQIAKNKLVADKRKDKNYTKELKSEIKDVKKNVKSDAILVDISYADHVCRTAELAEKYGKDFVNTFASNIADKIVVTSKKVDDGTYKPVYQTKNGNEITPENLRIAIINDGKDI